MTTTLICVSTYNRRKVAELSLENLRVCAPYADIWLYDDASTDYNAKKVFGGLVDRVVVNRQNQGIHELRARQVRDFVKSSFDELYFTDSDTIHDPGFMQVLGALRHAEPHHAITLYSSSQFKGPAAGLYGRRGHAGGISHLYTREQAERILEGLDGTRLADWDYLFPGLAQCDFAYSTMSYLEHFGAGGMHSRLGDWLHDRARYPTPFLQAIRAPVINYLNNAGPRPQMSHFYELFDT